MRRSRRAIGVIAVVVAATGAASQPPQQPQTPFGRALAAEDARSYRDAAELYKAVLKSGDTVSAILGLERVYDWLHWGDTLLGPLDTMLAARPRDAVLHGVQLRVLHSLRRPDKVRDAFERWVKSAPGDAAPFREYADMLLSDGAPAVADTILSRGRDLLGSGDALGLQIAQTRAALGAWGPSSLAWRVALVGSPGLVAAAVYSLTPAPAASRADIRTVLADAPVQIGARSVLAQLEMAWGSPAAGWVALQSLPPDSTTVTAWIDFGDRAEGTEAWGPARDAFAAALAKRPTPDLARRAAAAALNAADPTSAVSIAEQAERAYDSTTVARTVLSTHVRALAMLRRPDEASRLVDRYGPRVDPPVRADLNRAVSLAWAAVGDLTRARATLGADSDSTAGAAAGWLALYAGDLGTARRLLPLDPAASPAGVAALALLARTDADSDADIGGAFLLVARGDTAGAIAAFDHAAASAPEAAPLLVAMAARLAAARRDDAAAVAHWQRIVSAYPDAPEAAEADLEWGRSLRRTGDASGAQARFEHLVLTYPESALVPQARRELDLARSGIPPA